MFSMTAAASAGSGWFGGSKKPIALSALVAVFVSGCLGTLLNMMMLAPVHIITNIGDFSSDMVGQLVERRLPRILLDPRNVPIERFENYLSQNYGYEFTRYGEADGALRGKLQRMVIPVDEALERRLSALGLQAYFGEGNVLQYVSDINTRRTFLHVNVGQLTSGHSQSFLGRDVADIMHASSRKMVRDFGGQSRIGKAVSLLRHPPLRLFGRTLTEEITEGRRRNLSGTREGLHLYRARMNAAVRANVYKSIPESVVKKMPRLVFALIAPNDATAMDLFFRRIEADPLIRESLQQMYVRSGGNRGVFKFTAETIRPVLNRIIPLLVRSSTGKILEIATKTGAALVTGPVGAIVSALITILCDIPLLLEMLRSFSDIYNSFVHQQLISLYLAHASAVDQAKVEGFSSEQVEYFTEIFEGSLFSSLWGGAPEGSIAEASSGHQDKLKQVVSPSVAASMDYMFQATLRQHLSEGAGGEYLANILTSISTQLETLLVKMEGFREGDNLASSFIAAFCGVLDWASERLIDLAKILFSAVAPEALITQLGQYLSHIVQYLSGVFIDFFQENPVLDTEALLEEDPRLVGDLVVSGSILMSNEVIREAGGKPLSQEVAKKQLVERYLARVEDGLDTSAYDGLFTDPSPRYLANWLASPVYAQNPFHQNALNQFMNIGTLVGFEESLLEAPYAYVRERDGEYEVRETEITSPEVCQAEGFMTIKKPIQGDSTADSPYEEVCFELSHILDEGLMTEAINVITTTSVDIDQGYFDPNAEVLSEVESFTLEDIGTEPRIGGGLAPHSGLDTTLSGIFQSAGRQNNIPAAVIASLVSLESGGSLPSVDNFPSFPEEYWPQVQEAVSAQSGFEVVSAEDKRDPLIVALAMARWLDINRVGTSYESLGSDESWPEEALSDVLETYSYSSVDLPIDTFSGLYDNYLDKNDTTGISGFSGSSGIASAAMRFVPNAPGSGTTSLRPRSLLNFTYGATNVTDVDDSDVCWFIFGNSCVSRNIPAWCIELVFRAQYNATGTFSAPFYKSSIDAYSVPTSGQNFDYVPMQDGMAFRSGDALVLLNGLTNPSSGHGNVLVNATTRDNGEVTLQTVDGNINNKTDFITYNLIKEGSRYRIKSSGGGITYYLMGVWRYRTGEN